MGFMADGIEEFRKVPIAGKVVIVLIFAGVAYFGYRQYVAGKSGASASGSIDTTGNNPGYQTVPGPNNSQVPILPYGLQPIFDSAGNLLGYENPPPTSQGSSGNIPNPPVNGGPNPNFPKVGVFYKFYGPGMYGVPGTKPPVSQYTVKPGDTLFGISQSFYGNGAKYNNIYNANKSTIGSNPNLIKPGQVLNIPKVG